MTRRPNQYMQENWGPFVFDYAQLTATTAYVVFKAPYAMTIDEIENHNVTGLAVHADNNFKCVVTKTGGGVMATVFDTDADDGAAVAADTFQGSVALGTEALRTLAAGDVVTATFTEEGTATLPAGRLVFRGRRV